MTGTGADLVDELRAATEVTGVSGLRNVLSMALVEADRIQDARAALRHLEPRTKDFTWLYTDAGLCSRHRDSVTRRW